MFHDAVSKFINVFCQNKFDAFRFLKISKNFVFKHLF